MCRLRCSRIRLHHGKIKHLEKAVVGRKDRFGFGHFSELAVEALDGIGGVDQLPGVPLDLALSFQMTVRQEEPYEIRFFLLEEIRKIQLVLLMGVSDSFVLSDSVDELPAVISIIIPVESGTVIVLLPIEQDVLFCKRFRLDRRFDLLVFLNKVFGDDQQHFQFRHRAVFLNSTDLLLEI